MTKEYSWFKIDCPICGNGLRELPEQNQGEPVAWFRKENGENIYYATKAWDDCLPLYTKPQPKQEQGEPVGKFAKFNDGIWREVTDGSAGVPLYTHPKEWVELNKEDLKPICDEWRIIYGAWTHDFAKEIETKLKQKNNTGENNLS